MARQALLLDRDGVVNLEKNYLHKIEEFEFIAGIFDTCRYFAERGFALVIITNQAGIARGYYTESDYRHLSDWMRAQFADQGVPLDAVLHCPHHPDFNPPCICRKPEPGMLLQASRELHLDLGRSILVGDKASDIRAGRAAGVGLCVQVRSGHAINHENGSDADVILDGIADVPNFVAEKHPRLVR